MIKKFLYLFSFLYIGISLAQTCPTITLPLPDATNVSVTTTVTWTTVEEASGYYVLIGTTPGGRDLVDRVDVGNNTTFELPEGDSYPANTTISIKITIRFPDKPDQTCPYVLFTTGNAAPQQGCNHFINPVPDFYTCDPNEDNFEEFNIDLSVLESRLIGSQPGLTVTYHNPGGDLIDFSIGTQFAVNERKVMARATDSNGCYEETIFSLIVLPPPQVPTFDDVAECKSYTLTEIDNRNNYFSEAGGLGMTLFAGEVITISQRIYIYAEAGDCNNQSSFLITIDPTICEDPPKEISSTLFPNFFTPNGDGYNDFWQYRPSLESGDENIVYIRIFDRYGNLLKQLDPTSLGWDGSINGRRLPESDYWYLAASFSGQQLQGHFTLKR